MTIFKKVILTVWLGLFAMIGTANAHLVSVGWHDNGNGTISIWGEHWHGDQTSAYSANGGVTIDGIMTFQWTGFLNNSDRDVMVANGTLTGYAIDPGNGGGKYSDWFFTDPLVLGNGVHTIFTGTNCCVDTMTGPESFTFTGIVSVPPGTGPGNAVPEPASIALLGLGVLGFAATRRRSM
ncbi:PEP-CTERM sorting domain-containing protein [Undibacterium sp. Jales W-56]|uniref:PEP-CTERM sorting domain-containing protein n=1 Tax=Undibacterium sp. Jales W-56 TaxID=2897325 RepID=UPI0021CEC599|nr:PEP-CTERM sorting domain-containing protein [Undibacterium sp. Jales W-56]MCU6433243.1 PEP-CTERM sorting domain-containing protein [Undibacterium sp. Jales W-56]